VNALTATEVKVLNNLSDVVNPSVNLGDKVQQIISLMAAAGTPVNAVNAAGELAVTGVSVDGETVTIGADVYEFLADEAQTKTDPDNIAINIFDHTVQASQTLTVDTQPTSGDKMTIGTKEYTFVPVGTDTADGEISIGADLAGAQANIVDAINGEDAFNTPHPLVKAGTFDDDDCVITAIIGGTAGNAVETAETFTALTNIFGGGYLSSGANCSAANSASHLLAAINASGTEPVTASDGGSNKVELTADVAGAAANSINVGETMVNAAFTAVITHLVGGVNGTVGSVAKPLVDSTYLYICVADNTVSGKNWRRIALGSAF
jgi:hypothetical protein